MLHNFRVKKKTQSKNSAARELETVHKRVPLHVHGEVMYRYSKWLTLRQNRARVRILGGPLYLLATFEHNVDCARTAVIIAVRNAIVFRAIR